MHGFGLGLALYNFLPVLFTGLALFCIARLVRTLAPPDTSGLMAPLGALLVVLAGLCKVAWKLILALDGPDIPWLANALFPLMGPGFTLLALALWDALDRSRGQVPPRHAWRVALALIGLAYGIAALRGWGLGIERGWFLPLMVLASLANLGLTALLIWETWRRQVLWIAPLFLVNLAMIFALQHIARIEPKTLTLHWLEQSLTALGAGAFALGTCLLFRRVRRGLAGASYT